MPVSKHEPSDIFDGTDGTTEDVGFTGPDGFWYPCYRRPAGHRDRTSQDRPTRLRGVPDRETPSGS